LLRMEHGKPMLFGKHREKGIGLDPRAAQLEVVTIGEDGVSAEDVLVHDAAREDPTLAFMLANLNQRPGFPTPIGVFRSVRQPTGDELNWQQIASVKERKGHSDLRKVLAGSDTWTIK